MRGTIDRLKAVLPPISEIVPGLNQKTANELAGPCPWCGGNDRFVVFLDSGRFLCRRCRPNGGDVIDFFCQAERLDISGLEKKFLSDAQFAPEQPPAQRKTTGRYNYHDEFGVVRYWKERVEPGKDGRPKDFYFHHGIGANGRGCDPVLYNLPEVIRAKTVFIVEGEKHADLLKSWGLTSTTLDSGAQSKPTPEMITQLSGKRIVILRDNDGPGLIYAENLARPLRDKCGSLKVVLLPGLPEKGDILDWIKIPNNNKAKLLDFIKDVPEWRTEGASRHDDAAPLEFPNIMSGAAGDFARLYADHLEPPAQFFFMSYLACLGNLAAGRLNLHSEIQTEPRLYLLILGESADDRKSTAISKTVHFFRDNTKEFSICHGVGSAEGLQKILAETSRLLLCLDEFRAFTSKCKIESSVLMPAVTTLFESRQYESHTSKKSIQISNASLSLLAASTIDTYEGIFDEHFLAIGFPNRLFLCPGKGERRISIPIPIPEHSKAHAAAMLEAVLRHIEDYPQIGITLAARRMYHDWYLNLPQSVHAKRLEAYAMRLMPLLAVNELKTEVDEEIIQKVIALMDWQYQVRRRFDPIDADSVMARTEEKIRRTLLDGPKSKRDLSRACHANRIGVWAFENALNNLRKAGQIIFGEEKKYKLSEDGESTPVTTDDTTPLVTQF